MRVRMRVRVRSLRLGLNPTPSVQEVDLTLNAKVQQSPNEKVLSEWKEQKEGQG